MHHLELPHTFADLRRIDVDERRHAEPTVTEPLVVGEGVPQVPDPRDRDAPVLCEPQLSADLVDQGDVSPLVP